MKCKTILLIGLSILCMAPLKAQDKEKAKGLEAITLESLQGPLEFLSSDWMEGRETGLKGAWMAADYLASMLKLYGVKPAGDNLMARTRWGMEETDQKSYFQEFPLIQVYPDYQAGLSCDNGVGEITFTHKTDFDISPLEVNYHARKELVFAGYGIVNKELGIDSYQGLNVEGKIVLLLSGFPGSESHESPAWKELNGKLESSAYSIGRKAATARQMGAAGILIVSSHKKELYRWAEGLDFLNTSYNEGRPSSGRPYVRHRSPSASLGNTFINGTVSERAANEMLKKSDLSLAEFQNSMAENYKTPVPKASTNITIDLQVKTKLIRARNVIGMIEGEKKDEFLVLAAHYDHTGMGNGYVWNGADDNGSGTIGILTVAKAIQATGKKPEKSIIIAFWSGEEKGLLGSRYYVEYPTVPIGQIKMNLNLDMISRYITDDEPEKVTMTYTNTKPVFEEMTKKHIKQYKLGLKPDYQGMANPSGGSDHRAFVAKGIPIMRFKPGHREEYHTPYDEIPTLDWPIMEKIVKICFLNVWDLANTEW